MVTSVALPVLSRMQDDDDASRSWFLVATQSLALLTFPVFALLAVGAPAGIDVVFGREWEPAAAPLQAMALAGAPLVVRSLIAGLATSRGRTRIVLAWSTVTVVLQVVGFAVGLWAGGILGVAVSLVVVQYLTWFPYVAYSLRRVLGTPFREYLRVLVAPALASAMAAGVWWLVQAGQGGLYDAPGLVRISLSTVLALAAYLATVRLGWPRVYRSTASLLRQMGRRGGVAPAVVSPDPVPTDPVTL